MARLGKLTKALIGAGLLACSAAAMADPFTLIASAIVNIGGYVGLQAFAIYAGGALLSYSSAKRKARKARAAQIAAYNASLQDRTTQFSSTEAVTRICYGSPAPFAGNIVANFVSGDKDQFRHIVIDLVQHECDGVEAIYCDGVDIGALDGNGWVTGGEFFEDFEDQDASPVVFTGSSVVLPQTPVSGSVSCYINYAEEISEIIPVTVSGATVTCVNSGDFSRAKTVHYKTANTVPRLRVGMHLGTGGTDTADAYLISQVPGKWTAAHKLTGHTYAVVTMDLNLSRFQGGPGTFTFKLRGKKVYDPRTTLTAYSANPALCLMDYLRTEHGGATPLAAFDAGWISAANACDTAAYTPAANNGNRAELFRCDGLVSLDQGRETIIEGFETACSGELSESAGMYRLRVGVWSAPVLTLTDADAFGFVEQVQGGEGLEGCFNGARGAYLQAGGLGATQDAVPFSNAAFLAADGGKPRINDVFLGMIGSEMRAQQAMRISVERSRAGLVFKLPVSDQCWPLQPGDRITWTYSPYAITAETFRVTSWTQTLAGAPAIEITKDYPGIWDLANETNPYPEPSSGLSSGFNVTELPAPTADSGDDYLTVAGDGSIITGVYVSWPQSTDGNVLQGGFVRLRYRSVLDASGTWQPAPLMPGDQESTIIFGLQDGLHYQIQVRFENQRGITGPWGSITHQVIGKTAPPPNVEGAAIVTLLDGNRINWLLPTVADYKDTWLKRGTVWSTALELGANGEPIQRRATSYPLGWLAAGVTTILLRHRDTSENLSETAIAASITILPPSSVQLTRSDVEANTLSVRWLDAKTSQPILRYYYKVGTTAQSFAAASDFGSTGSDGRSDVLISPVAGLRRVWFVAVDVAGNESTPIFIDVNFALPTDFTLANRFDATFAGSGTNVIVNAGRVYLLDTDEQDGTHFSSRGWTNDQNAITAGNPLYFQPGSTTASYSEEYDLGAVAPTTTIKVTQQVTWLAGSGTIETDIAYKTLIGDPWTTVANVSQLVASNLRYIRVTVRAIAAGGDDLAQLISMFTECSLKRLYEPFTLVLNAADAGGTPYVTSAGFVDIQSATASPDQASTNIVRGPYYTIDDGGATKRVLWTAFDNAGTRVSGTISGQISGV